RRDQRCDDVLVGVAADPKSLRRLTSNGRTRGAREVAAEHHERYVSRRIRSRRCRDLHQVAPSRASCAWGAGYVGCVRPGIRFDPCSQQAGGSYEGRIQIAGEMQEPAPFVPGLQPGVVPGIEPIASPIAIEVHTPRTVKGPRARVRAALLSVAQADIVGTIDVAVATD